MSILAHGATLVLATAEEQQHDDSLYGYTPTEWICILFVVLFSLSTLIHVAQAIRFRMWWIFPTAILAGIAEVIGWAGRLWSSSDPTYLTPYLIQITTTIIAPTPLVAANFVILASIIERLGRQYSRLSPKLYTLVFCSFDIIALVVQAVGGALASNAVQTNGDPEKGGHIMLGGIVFQMFAITVYVGLAGEFLTRWALNKPVRPVNTDLHLTNINEEQTLIDSGYGHDSARPVKDTSKPDTGARGVISTKLKLMVAELCFSTIVIFIRSVYRTIELADGWTGVIINTQVYFNVLDGAMIVLAMFCLNFLHPGWLLR